MADIGRTFTERDLYINQDTLRAPYRRRRRSENKTALKWGQRKLLISEIEFFTLFWNADVIPNPLCVYVGAAPGVHIPLLSQMFPSITFHLYDPAEFGIEATDKIQLFNQYFTDEVAQQYAGRNDIFLISDIRTADHSVIQQEVHRERGLTGNLSRHPKNVVAEADKIADQRNEDQIWGDMRMQQSWVLLINPEHALLKGRLPYVLDGKDHIVEYLQSEIYWQAWRGQTSTETRFKPIRNTDGVYELGQWSILEYEQWNFHHNTIVRENYLYLNPFTKKNEAIHYPELLNDYDSTLEAFILRAYFQRLNVTDNLYALVQTTSNLITERLNAVTNSDKSLSERRALAAKRAHDPFRYKGSSPVLQRIENKPLPTGTFQHSQININPSWRSEKPGPTPTLENKPPIPKIVPAPDIITGQAVPPSVITGRPPFTTPSPILENPESPSRATGKPPSAPSISVNDLPPPPVNHPLPASNLPTPPSPIMSSPVGTPLSTPPLPVVQPPLPKIPTPRATLPSVQLNIPQPTIQPPIPQPKAQLNIPQPTIQPPIPQPTIQPPIPQPSVQPPIPQPTVQFNIPQPTIQPPIPQPTIQPRIPQPKAQFNIPQPTVQPPIPQPTVQFNIPQPSMQPPIPQPKVQPPIPQPTVQPPIPQPTVQFNIPQPSVQPPIPQPSVQPPIPQPSVQPPIPQPKAQFNIPQPMTKLNIPLPRTS